MLLPQSYQYPNLSEGADRIGGQLCGDKRVPLQWRNQFWQSLEEGARKRCSECVVGVGGVWVFANTRVRSGQSIWRACCYRCTLRVLTGWKGMGKWKKRFWVGCSVAFFAFVVEACCTPFHNVSCLNVERLV